MSDSHDSPNFIQHLIKLFYLVGGVLVAGTLITVVIDVSFEMSLGTAAIVGLSIALVKAGCVVVIFMHYKWDMKLIMITWTMLLTFFFFAGMMGLIMWAEGDLPRWGREEVPIVWPILASLLGIVLPVSFTFLTVKVLSQSTAVEAESNAEPKANVEVLNSESDTEPKAIVAVAESQPDIIKPKVKRAVRKAEPDTKPKAKRAVRKAEPDTKPKAKRAVRKAESDTKPKAKRAVRKKK